MERAGRQTPVRREYPSGWQRGRRRTVPAGTEYLYAIPAKHPEAGRSRIVFPDDVTSMGESSLYRQAGITLLLSYDPAPRFLNWVRPFVNCLHVVSPEFRKDRSRIHGWWRQSSRMEVKLHDATICC